VRPVPEEEVLEEGAAEAAEDGVDEGVAEGVAEVSTLEVVAALEGRMGIEIMLLVKSDVATLARTVSVVEATDVAVPALVTALEASVVFEEEEEEPAEPPPMPLRAAQVPV